MKKLLAFLFCISFLLGACKPNASTQTPALETNIAPNQETQEPTQEPTPYDEVVLKINKTTSLGMAPIYLAEELGYFAKFGISLESITFARGMDAVPLMATGDLDIYTGPLVAGLINIIQQDQSLKVVADRGSVTPDSCSYIDILVRKDLYDSGVITSVADLKGQNIAATPASASGYYLSKYLAEGGLTFEDVEIVDIPYSAFMDGFANKSLAAAVVTEPTLTRMLQAGNAEILSKITDLGKVQISVVIFGKNMIQQNPDIGARFMAAYLMGVEKYNEGKTEENIRILTAASGEDESIVRESCWIPVAADGKVDFLVANQYQEWALAQGLVNQLITEEQFWDPSFIISAEEIINQQQK